MSKCPKCGIEVATGMKFCGECGEVLPVIIECPQCHFQLAQFARFCQECGFRLGESSAPAAGTSNNTYIKQEIKQETELDKEAKRVQIEKLRLEKEHQEKEMARRSVLAEASLEVEKTRKAAELAQEKMKLQEIEQEANKSPYSKNTFRKLGLWSGFLGLHYAYVKRWPLFAVTIALMIGMAIFGKQTDPNAAEVADAVQIEQAAKTDAPSGKPEKTDPITLILGVGLMVMWFGGAFFITTDAQGRKLM